MRELAGWREFQSTVSAKTLTLRTGSFRDFLNILASSTGLLLKTTGLKVTAIKIDPYMNIDAGTMAPTEHGASILNV